jgi:hypothetical protein
MRAARYAGFLSAFRRYLVSVVFSAPTVGQYDCSSRTTRTIYTHNINFLTSTQQTRFTSPTLTDGYGRDAALPQCFPHAFRSNERHYLPFQTRPLPKIQFFSSALAHTPYCDVIRGGRRPDCMAPRRHLKAG